jgi:hypothetical protein
MNQGIQHKKMFILHSYDISGVNIIIEDNSVYLLLHPTTAPANENEIYVGNKCVDVCGRVNEALSGLISYIRNSPHETGYVMCGNYW